MAELTINPETFNVRHFLASTGYTGRNERHRNTLRLPDWTQAEADAALAAYDPGWVDPASIPTSVTPLQARKALRAAGLKASVDAWITQQDEETQEAWEFAVEIERNSDVIVNAAASLGLTDEQVDNLFIAASQL